MPKPIAEQSFFPEPLPLWPDGKSGDSPELTIYKPSPASNRHAAVIIFPGGGYGMHSMEKEGHKPARWLCSLGLTAVICPYRLSPNRHPIPLGDAHRAIRTVRGNAEAWGIDPEAIGVMGYSAGGHLAAHCSTVFDEGNRRKKDPIEHASSRPDFSILIYPVITTRGKLAHKGSANNLLGTDPKPTSEQLKSVSPELLVSPQTAPAFLAHGDADVPVPPENSVLYYSALKKVQIEADLHIYVGDDHGFSLNPDGQHPWVAECERWLEKTVFNRLNDVEDADI